ncbi:FtsQ-type POTRA domain-containing protein [Patescibacteria group bacterium]
MRIRKNRHIRSLKHLYKKPTKFLFKSNILKWLFVLFVFFLISWSLTSSFFRINVIECSTATDKPCDQEVLAELNRYKGQSTFLVNTKKIENKIASANPTYSGISVTARLPNIISINMDSKKTYANLKVASKSATLIVDQDLFVVSKQPKPTPGAFTIISKDIYTLGVGDKIEDELTLSAFSIAEEFVKNYLSFEEVNVVSKTEIIIKISGEKTAIITSTEDVPRQVTSLQLILSKATISPEPRIYDMRFDKPVLKY